MSTLRIEGLSAWHKAGKPVLSDISLTADSGKITAILGPNGAGKSTLLKAIAGLVECEGTAVLNETNLFHLPPKERAKRMAYVPQRSSLRAGLHVRRVVELGRFAHWEHLQRAGANDLEIVSHAMQQTQTQHLAQRRFTELSGGEQQRVLLARAIATGSQVLLLDEPTSALDIRHSLMFRSLLLELRDAGYTVLIVLHDLNEAMQLADNVALLSQGLLVAFGRTTDVLTETAVYDTYRVHMTTQALKSFALESA